MTEHWTAQSSSNNSEIDLRTRIRKGEIGVVWRAEKKKGEGQIKKEKKEEQIVMEASVVLTGLRLIKPGVEGSGKVAMRVGRSREAVMGVGKPGEAVTAGAERPASFSSLAFLLSPVFLLLSTSSTSRQAIFLAYHKRF